MTGILIFAVLTLATPENNAVYDLHSPCVKEFLANGAKRGEKPARPPLTTDEIRKRDEANAKYEAWVAAGRNKAEKCKPWTDRFNYYMHNPWSEQLMKRAADEEKNYRPFTWRCDAKDVLFKVEFSEDAAFSRPIVERTRKQSLRPAYLKLATRYYWRVKGNGEISDVRTFTTSEVPPRMIGVPSMNMRDMGGGCNVQGRRVRQGLLYRGQASAARATPDELRSLYIDKLAIRSELDLRSREEFLKRCREWGETDLASIGIRHEFHPIIPYHMHYPANLPELRKIFTFLADKANYPVYFHCAVGSDRTGTLAFLLDGVIGREDGYFYDNYELPSFNANLPRYRYCRKGAEIFRTFGGDGAPMRERVIAYLLQIGVRQNEIDAIRGIMLDPGQ